jgi:hypothetical protein
LHAAPRGGSRKAPPSLDITAAARLVLDKIAASSPYSAELAKRAVYAEIQAERAAELPAVRARLDRLIEARATVLAEEMYEERKHLELEAVKAEMLRGL